MDQKNHGKVSVAVIVMLVNRQSFINKQKLLPPWLPTLLKLHLSIQEPKFNDDSVTGDMPILLSQKFKEDKGLCLGNNNVNNKSNEILYRKQNRRMAVQLMSCYFLHHKIRRKTKDSI